MEQHDNLINGEWTAGASYSANTNPSNLADVLGEYAQGDAGQVDAAVAAATAAFPAWSTGDVQARSEALDKIGNEILARKEELGTLLAREEGKTKAEGIGEATRAGRSSSSSPVSACASPVKSFLRCVRASASRSRANRSALSV